MPAPDQDTVLNVLREAIDFTRRVGAISEADALEPYHTRFQTEKPTLKALRGAFQHAKDKASLKITDFLFDECRDPRPGMEKVVKEYERVWIAFGDLIYPPEPQPAEMDGSKLAGGQFLEHKSVPYFGEPRLVPEITERTIEVVRRYSEAIGCGDFAAAYSMTASGLRAWMNLKRFVTDHEQAAKHYHGPALDYLIARFQYVYADDASRQKSKADEGWPKATPKEDRRSCVTGFWIRDRTARTGCWGGFLISEEHGEYRIAKFTFYSQ